MENLVNTIVIEKYMTENKLSKTKFCEACKISVYTLNRILCGKNVRITALFRIARTMGIKFYKMF